MSLADRNDNLDRVVLRTAGLGKQVSSPEGPLTILDDVSLEIRAGETVALVGPSGAGKTTLLALLAGLDQPSSGRVWLCGEDLTQLDEDGRARLRGKRVGFVFQSFHLVQGLTARDNVALPSFFAAAPPADTLARAQEALERVGLQGKAARLPSQLSGGERQRVAIARALFARPKVLLCDEPTGNLDAATSEQVVALFRELNRGGLTVLAVTHEERLRGAATRVLTLAEGKLQ